MNGCFSATNTQVYKKLLIQYFLSICFHEKAVNLGHYLKNLEFWPLLPSTTFVKFFQRFHFTQVPINTTIDHSESVLLNIIRKSAPSVPMHQLNLEIAHEIPPLYRFIFIFKLYSDQSICENNSSIKIYIFSIFFHIIWYSINIFQFQIRLTLLKVTANLFSNIRGKFNLFYSMIIVVNRIFPYFCIILEFCVMEGSKGNEIYGKWIFCDENWFVRNRDWNIFDGCKVIFYRVPSDSTELPAFGDTLMNLQKNFRF